MVPAIASHSSTVLTAWNLRSSIFRRCRSTGAGGRGLCVSRTRHPLPLNLPHSPVGGGVSGQCLGVIMAITEEKPSRNGGPEVQTAIRPPGAGPGAQSGAQSRAPPPTGRGRRSNSGRSSVRALPVLRHTRGCGVSAAGTQNIYHGRRGHPGPRPWSRALPTPGPPLSSLCDTSDTRKGAPHSGTRPTRAAAVSCEHRVRWLAPTPAQSPGLVGDGRTLQ